jgi:hypothetical protein
MCRLETALASPLIRFAIGRHARELVTHEWLGDAIACCQDRRFRCVRHPGSDDPEPIVRLVMHIL